MSAPGWNRHYWNRERWGRGPWGDPDGALGGRSPWDRTRVFRDKERAWIAGVCAGIADYMGTEPMLVRLVAVVFLIFFFLPAIVAYIAFALVLKPKPPTLFASATEESFWRGMRGDPGGTLHGLRDRFATLERRLVHAEALVASDEFELRRGFRDLGDDRA